MEQYLIDVHEFCIIMSLCNYMVKIEMEVSQLYKCICKYMYGWEDKPLTTGRI